MEQFGRWRGHLGGDGRGEGGGCWSEAGPGLELGTGPGHLLMSAVNEHQLIPLLLASQIAKIKD